MPPAPPWPELLDELAVVELVDEELLVVEPVEGEVTRVDADRLHLHLETTPIYTSTALISTRLDGQPTTGDDLSQLRIGGHVRVMTLVLHPPALVAVGVVRIVDGQLEYLRAQEDPR